jgi:hypothetical protein
MWTWHLFVFVVVSLFCRCAGLLYRAGFLLLLFSLLALCSCGLRELFVCVVSFSGFGIRLCPLLCMNRWCVYHTLEPVVFQSLARGSLLLFQCGFLLETAVCLHGRLCEGFFWELEFRGHATTISNTHREAPGLNLPRPLIISSI